MAQTSSFIPLGEQQEDADAVASLPTRDKVIGLINEAQMVNKEKKLSCLNQVKELIINKDRNLLDSFLDEVIAFARDPAPDVRKFVVTFMEEASKSDPGLLVRVIPILNYMLEDDSTVVIKRVLASVIQIYKLALLYVAKMKVVDSDMEEMWETLEGIKQNICGKVESDNDGVRTIAIKFMEFLVLAQTKKELSSETNKSSDTEVSLDVVAASHPMLNPAELREEAGMTMGSLLQMTVSPTVSSVNLMTCIISLATIARQRPSYISTVLQAFELLHANLPPHFATSQISSVRKQLKTQVINLLRQPSSYECREQITTLLTDLGCTQVEIAKNTPREALKKTRAEAENLSASKKMRLSGLELSSAVASGKVSGLSGGAGDDKPTSGSALLEAIEMTTNDLKPLLTPEAVTELVIANMDNIPSSQPKSFGHSYTPIAAAGTEAQVRHLARLLASQMTSAGIGVGAQAKGILPQQQSTHSESPGCSPVVRDPRKRPRDKEGDDDDKRDGKRKKIKDEEEDTSEDHNLEKSMRELSYLGSLLGLPNIMDPMFPIAYATFFGPSGVKTEIKTEKTEFVHASNLVEIPTTPSEEDSKELKEKDKRKMQLQATIPQKLKRIHKFEVSSLVKVLDEEHAREMTVAAFRRILNSEKSVCRGGAGADRVRLIVNLVTLFRQDFKDTLLEFILEDFRGRLDIAIAWLYAEYCIAEGYLNSDQSSNNYNSCLISLMLGTKEKLEPRDRLFTKLILESPKVTPDALEIIKSYCCEEERAFLGVSTLKELVLRRPRGPGGTEDFLQALLEITISDIELARIQSMHIAKKFYAKPELAMKIERVALQRLQLLLQDHPMFEEQTMDDGTAVAVDWTEASVKKCFSLFVTLLPLNHKLLRDLAFVYTSTSPTVKRVILRQLDQPVRSIGMTSPDLLQLIESCPPGGETLIMRMLHILTEGAAPSPELVNRVRELYQRNYHDVRFLIPVLHGLTKKEIITALPKFVRLSANLVKGVFDRLLVSHRGDQGHCPVTPSELLIALHNIYCKGDDNLMKCVIKATNLCFQERSIFSQEVLAVVLQQLLEQDPIPVLFMRTVLQSLAICPKLTSFVMTILIKLISKQVWTQPKVWQGFVKCCEVTKPHSFQVLLRLPSQQLDNLLKSCPSIQAPFYSHIQKLPNHQKATISRPLLQVIEKLEPSGAVAKKVKSEKKRRQSSRTSDKGDKDTANLENTNSSSIA